MIKVRIQYLFSFVIILSLFFILFMFIPPAFAVVDLLYFRAISINNMSVRLEWETASETGTQGFLLNKTDDPNGIYEPIGEFVPASGGFSGNSYVYTDTNVIPGATYWYKLQEVDSIQNITDIASSSVMVGKTQTSTQAATATKTPTQIRTPKKGGSSSYKSPTATHVASAQQNPTATTFLRSTNLPISPLVNPTTTNVSQDQATSQSDPLLANPEAGTSTLEPLPSLELVFPATSTHDQNDISAPTPDNSSSGVGSRWLSSKGLTIIGVIVVLWLVLGGWFLYSFRRME
jgi:hypothetical protein